MSASMPFRSWASTYVTRRISKADCLHFDVFAYQLTEVLYVIKYELRKGGKGEPVLTLWFAINSTHDADPVHLPSTHPYIIDASLTEPVKLTGRDRTRALSTWFTRYHHEYLRQIATEYPVSAYDCKSRSVRFHYFSSPDHNPADGFRNFFTTPKRVLV